MWASPLALPRDIFIRDSQSKGVLPPVLPPVMKFRSSLR